MATRPLPRRQAADSTSWDKVGKWYGGIVGEEGHYYHRKIIIPGALRLLQISPSSQHSVLDLACGQGVLARHLPKNVPYSGVDLSATLIKEAKKNDENRLHEFSIGDASKSLTLKKKNYSHASIILALQNIEFPEKVIQNAFEHLQEEGKFLIVLNHPCFRIPRQSSWGIDEVKKMQFRRLDRYFGQMKIPIQAHPSQGQASAETWSFHHPLASYSRWLYKAGFQIQLIEEWCSDKVSTGKNAKMENRSREEFPLFMAILAVKPGQKVHKLSEPSH